MRRLVDLSNNNGIAGRAAITDPSIGAVYAKATEGLSFKDELYPEFRAAARKANKPFGGYLFLHPDQDGAAQARAFLLYAKPKVGDLQPVVDSETGSPAQAVKATVDALRELAAHGYSPILYGSSSYLKTLREVAPVLRRYRAWQAEYGPVLHRVPGLNTVAWQLTDHYVVAKGRLRVDASQVFVRDFRLLEIPPWRNLRKPKPVPVLKPGTKKAGGGTARPV